jgi:hypothetical protein
MPVMTGVARCFLNSKDVCLSALLLNERTVLKTHNCLGEAHPHLLRHLCNTLVWMLANSSV